MRKHKVLGDERGGEEKGVGEEQGGGKVAVGRGVMVAEERRRKE